MFNQAIRWELVERNPITLVKTSGKRLKKPRVLTAAEFKAIVGQLNEPYKTMVLVIGCLGLRVCELLGLQWQDIDFKNLTAKVQRSVVTGEINATKTDASESILPIGPDLGEVLLQHKAKSAYKGETDFVFANGDGKPPWKDSILQDYIQPAGKKLGIEGIGWHTFRRTYSTLLHALGTAPVVQKELLRHADIRTTLNVYTQAISAEKREACSKLTHALLVPVGTCSEMAVG